ncbi:MAG: hypothetical protein PHD56_05420 [Anaerostipes sp.]|nr:hypothetical protein [Anaerostipes sp.]
MKKKKFIKLVLCLCCIGGVATVFSMKKSFKSNKTVSTKSQKKNRVTKTVSKKETNGVVYLKADANGKLKEEDTGSDVPISVKITYFLNNKKISAKDISGKSGKIKIRFDYKNLRKELVTVDEKQMSMPVPFMMISTVVMPTDTFSNIKVSNGKIMKDEEQSIAVGMAFPDLKKSLKLANYKVTQDIDLPDYVEITAEAKDFELSFTANIVGSMGLSDLDSNSFDDVDQMLENVNKMGDASDNLVDGSAQLLSGIKAYQKGVKAYTNGVEKIKEGIHSLNQSLKSLSISDDSEMELVKEASKTLAQDAKTLGTNFIKLEGQITIVERSAQIQAKNQAVEEFNEGLEQAVAEGTIDEEQKKKLQGKIDFHGIKITLDDIESNASENVKLLEDIGKQMKILSSFLSKISKMSKGMTQLTKGINAIDKGTRNLTKNNKSMTQGIKTLVGGTSQLSKGVRTFDQEGINKIEDLSQNELTQLLKNFKALQKAEIQYKDNQKELGNEASYVIETESI